MQVVWDPHRLIRDDRPFLDIAFFSGCLKCMDVVEPYHPERVLRQFGRIQTIPRAPLAPERASRGATAASYRIRYVFYEQLWDRWEDHLLSTASRSHPVTRPSDCVPGFLEWFSRITHLAVHPPESRSSIYSRSRPDDADADVLGRRIADALGLCTGILDMDREEAAASQGTHMYDVILGMAHTLQGQHISTEEHVQPDVPGPSHASPQQYRRRRRRGGDP